MIYRAQGLKLMGADGNNKEQRSLYTASSIASGYAECGSCSHLKWGEYYLEVYFEFHLNIPMLISLFLSCQPKYKR